MAAPPHGPASLARIRAAALDGYSVAPYDERELARLRTLGIDDSEHDAESEVDRLTALGAHLAEHQGSDHTLVLRDPEGNEFCVIRTAAP